MSPEAEGRGRARAAIAIAIAATAGLTAAAAASAAPPERPGSRAAPGPAALEGAPRGESEAVDRLRTAARGQRYVPGEVIVGYRRQTAPAERAAVRAATEAALEERLPVARAELLEIGPNRSPVAVARRLERLREVAYAQPNYVRSVSEIPNDPAFTALWGLHNAGQLVRRQTGTAGADISATAAWEITTGDGEVTVAVVDTGVDAGHPDLAANIAAGGRDFVEDDNDPSDLEGHGTHVAGTIGAVGGNGVGITGVAQEVGLLPIRVLDEAGNGNDADIAAGFAYAAAQGARIVNASLGGEGAAPVLDAAIAAAPQTLFVVAAGNDGSDNDATPFFPCNSPGANVICVAASDSRDELAGFSNFGTTSVDLAAPGVDINSTAAAGVDREYFFEGFEEPLAGRWTPGGSNNTWGLEGAPAFSGDWSAADSPGGNYLPSTNAWIDGPPFSVADGSDCELNFWLSLQAPDPQDALLVEGNPDNVGWEFLDPVGWSSASGVFVGHDATLLDGAQSGQIAFRMFTDGDANVDDGAHVDHVSVVCEGAGRGYDFLSGTSMATPHVAGVAALVLAEYPDATVAALRDAVLDSVDAQASLAGIVATSGRLNAEAAVEAVPPRARITSGPSGPIADREPSFEFSSSKPGSFECRIDGSPFAPCASGHQLGPLADGPHTFRVRAVNEHGPGTAATRAFAVRTRAPVTTIRRGPKRVSRKRVARFRFTADESPASFECRLDKRKWKPCVSPRRQRVKPGRHVFRIRATDEVGNRGKPAVHRFRVRR